MKLWIPAIAFWCCTLLMSGTVAAQALSPGVTAKAYTKGELALMPEWCIDSQDGPYGGPEGGDGLNRSPRARQWVSAMGTDFWHMHHYCRGIRDTLRLRAASLTPSERTFLAGRAVGEFDYVIGNCKPSMPLLPEVFLKRGEMQALLGDVINAMDSFDNSRKLKADYWPAYDRWLGILIGLKQYEKAKSLAEESLRASPDQPNLLAHQKTIEAALKTVGQRPAQKPQAPSKASSR